MVFLQIRCGLNDYLRKMGGFCLFKLQNDILRSICFHFALFSFFCILVRFGDIPLKKWFSILNVFWKVVIKVSNCNFSAIFGHTGCVNHSKCSSSNPFFDYMSQRTRFSKINTGCPKIQSVKCDLFWVIGPTTLCKSVISQNLGTSIRIKIVENFIPYNNAGEHFCP